MVKGISKVRAEGYDRHRFPYSEKAIIGMLEAISPRAADIADIGCGTGLVTKHLVGRCDTLYAVDPDPAMLGVAKANLNGAPGLQLLQGYAESTGIPDASVDLIVAGNAYHRFDKDRAVKEFARILRPGGWMAIISYGNVENASHPGFGNAIGTVMGKYRDRISEGKSTRNNGTPEEFMGTGEYLRFMESQSISEGWEGFWSALAWETPAPEDDWYDAFKSDIDRVFTEHIPVGGNLVTTYATEIILGKPIFPGF